MCVGICAVQSQNILFPSPLNLDEGRLGRDKIIKTFKKGGPFIPSMKSNENSIF